MDPSLVRLDAGNGELRRQWRLDDPRLSLRHLAWGHDPTRANDGIGHAGDIAAAGNGGFALSSNRVGLTHLWHPGAPDKLTEIVNMEEAYALGRWHPTAKPILLTWPRPMALDNHWVLLSEA